MYRSGRGPPKSARPVKLSTNGSSFRTGFRIENNTASSRAEEPAYGPEWEAIRKLVISRDNYTCTKCRVVHRPPNHGKLDAHHIIRREKGGPDSVDNLRTLCKPCHALEHSHLQRIGYGQPKKRKQW